MGYQIRLGGYNTEITLNPHTHPNNVSKIIGLAI